MKAQNQTLNCQKTEKTPRNMRLWTPQEDRRLLRLVKRYSSKWEKVASSMGSRNGNQCLHRYRRIKGMNGRKVKWSEQQDGLVYQLVQQFGKNWKKIAQSLPGKSGKQIRERYINHLDPNINKSSWLPEEDRTIISLYNKLGSKWKLISEKLQGRPQNMVKNHFHSHIRRFYKGEINSQPVIDTKEDLDEFFPVENQDCSLVVSDIYQF